MDIKQYAAQIGRFLARTWVWSLLMVLLASLLVWFVGPLLAVAEQRFWASPLSRLLSIGLLLLLWGGALGFADWRGKQRKRHEQSAEQAQESLRQQSLIGEEQAELRHRYREAVRTLKGRREKWREELPWYLLIGPEGGGKTSLLDFSGLEFPLNQGTEQRLTREVAGTLYADWYFAEQAVLIDTAGRYLSQPDPAVDSLGWQTLLHLLRRRRTRPLNGVLVTLPVDVLQSGDELALEHLARQTRQRLQEIHQQLGVDVPVYLVLGKADKVPGFAESFDQLSREDADQVLGMTFRPGQCATEMATLRAEFEALLRRLNHQVIPRMHQERDTVRRGRILDFPHQIGQLGEQLCLFVELAFAGNRYQRASQLRGLYLTSAPQLEGGLDPLTLGIGQQLGLASSLLPSLHTGKPRFIHNLFAQVIFPEAPLASLDGNTARRLVWGQRALYAGALGCVLAMTGLWTNGFSDNQARLERLRQIAEALPQAHEQLQGHDDIQRMLEVLNTSHSATLVFPQRDTVAFVQRGGLYQREQVEPVVQENYQRDLQALLLPRVRQQLEAQLQGRRADRDGLLASLRAYLMLNLPERRDAEFLADSLAADWSRLYPGDTAVQDELNGHFRRLLAEPFPPQSIDAGLVAEVRQVLRSESLAGVVYRMLRDQAQALPEYRFHQHLGPQATLLNGSDHGIPGLYTQRGYRNYLLAQGPRRVEEILRDNWVLGEGEGLSAHDLSRLLADVEQLYFRDYAYHWSQALEQLEPEPIGNAAQGARLVAGLGSPSSPLLQLLIQIRENTQFGGSTEPTDAASELLASVPGATALGARLGGTVPDTARKAMDRHFAPLHRLLDDSGNAGPELTASLRALDELHSLLNGLAQASQPEQTAFELARQRMSGRADALSQLRSNATRMPKPVGQWLEILADDSWMLILSEAQQHLNQRYQAELYAFYQDALRQRYPFEAQSQSEVSLADFREFFKSKGVADRFFESHLKPFVTGSGHQLKARLVDGRGLPLSPHFLVQLGKAEDIRRSFFAENPDEPGVQFKLESYLLDSNMRRAEFRLGNQQHEYRHGPIAQTSFRWPDQTLDGRASVLIEEIGGRRIAVERNSGHWSLFRLLDQLQVEHHSGRDVLLLKAHLEDRRAQYLLHSQRSPNPFDPSLLRSFKLPAVL
jgi:type VI secretion system protein ImpL